MKEAFLNFVSSQKLCTLDDKILLGVSGGVDSMVMAHLFVHSGFEVAIAHVNYGLRGEDSIRDELIALNFAKENSIPIYIQKVEPQSLKAGGSLQMNAREIRYQFFTEIALREQYNKIATAHQLNDSLETILLNLTRGTGISGIKGVPVAAGNIIRPLMFTSRNEVESYAVEQGILWGEDSSNAKNIYNRNRIRNEVIPILSKINPGLLSTFEDTQLRLAGAAQIVEAAVTGFLAKNMRKEDDLILIDIKGYGEGSYWLTMLAEVLVDYGFNFSQVKDIHGCILRNQVGTVFHSEDFELNVDRSQLLISKIAQETEEESLVISEDSSVLMAFGLKITISREAGNGLPELRSQNEAFFDSSLLRFPLTLRKWRNGDKFVPLGMKGRKMVSDFMIDHKIPLSLKRDVFVLLSGEEIVWLVNYRISDLVKITKGTSEILKITVERS